MTLNSPTCYYLGAHGPQGLEYRLAAAFADSLGVHLVVLTEPDMASMQAALIRGEADLSAGQISADATWRRAGLPAAPYADIAQLVVQARGRSPPANIAGLQGARLTVLADSPQERLLRTLRREAVHDLTWKRLPGDAPTPLDMISSGDADYAVVDASDYAFARHLYPETVAAFALPDPRPVQWVLPAGAVELRQAVERFFDAARASGALARIQAEARSESGDFDYLSAHQFQTDIASRLPALQGLFEDAAEATGLDWRLLAAVGYQESRWHGSARSADGASGIMMLTGDTAATVGVDDRADLRENILGGAKYLVQVIDTIPQRIPEPDRTWLALAAYNVGYGHLEDARVLAQMHGLNPDSWADVRTQLPLLAQEQWYSRLKRGYARGWEPARYVEQVRRYLAVLEWLEADHSARSLAQAAHATPIASFEMPRPEAPQPLYN